MKKFQVVFILALVLVLSACNGDKEESSNAGSADDGEAVNENGTLDHGVKDKGVGFSMTGESIEEAEEVPEEEKEQILEAFDVYIETFNDKDVDGYMNGLSKHTESFDLDKERTDLEELFNEHDVKREVSDETIVKYSENESHVFAKLKTSIKQLSSGLNLDQSGRQVTVFTKDDGDWKVASIHYLGDQEK